MLTIANEELAEEYMEEYSKGCGKSVCKNGAYTLSKVLTTMIRVNFAIPTEAAKHVKTRLKSK
jgi:hypothetical protein